MRNGWLETTCACSLPRTVPRHSTLIDRRAIRPCLRQHQYRCTAAVSPASTGNSQGAERQALFSSIAPVYDQLNDMLSLGQHRIWKKLAVQWCQIKEGDTVLDVCCGTGDLAYLLAAAAGPRGEVTAVDFSADMLDYAQQRAESHWGAAGDQQARIQWVQWDALSLQCADGQFDAATVGYGLRNVADIPRALRELCRVVKPGAQVCILDFNNSGNPVVRQLQRMALENVVVPTARSYGMEEQYAYLQPSIERFPTGREQERLALGAGFHSATHYELGFGLMGLLVATK